jgi:hypothetical protein
LPLAFSPTSWPRLPSLAAGLTRLFREGWLGLELAPALASGLLRRPRTRALQLRLQLP